MAQAPVTRPSLLARLNDPQDQAAWDEFLAVYGPLVFADLRRRGCSHTDSEDITQRVFARVFRGLKSFHYSPQRGRFRDWLGTIVRNEFLRDHRTRARKPALLLPSEDLDTLVDDTPDAAWVEAFQARVYQVAMERCRPRFEPATWTAFEQVWVHNLSSSDAAAMSGLSVESVYVAKSRVLSAISDVIRELTDDLIFP